MINIYKTFAVKTLIVAIAVSFVLGMNYLYAAWSAPTATPPGGNADAPINVSGTAQDKTGALSVGSLLANGNSSVLGGLDVSGNLDIGGWFRTIKGTVAAGNVLTSDANGWATWQAPSLSVNTTVVTKVSTVSATVQAFCPAGYVRTGCSGGVYNVGDTDSKYHGSRPSGTNGCEAVTRRPGFTVTVQAYCAAF